jgi:hypothetical protein
MLEEDAMDLLLGKFVVILFSQPYKKIPVLTKVATQEKGLTDFLDFFEKSLDEFGTPELQSLLFPQIEVFRNLNVFQIYGETAELIWEFPSVEAIGETIGVLEDFFENDGYKFQDSLWYGGRYPFSCKVCPNF